MKQYKAQLISGLAFTFLLIFFIVRLSFASLFKPFWPDETHGFCLAVAHTVTNLFLHGAGEASPSPLYYLLERAAYAAFHYAPQEYFDIRLFNRIPQILHWSFASCGVGLYACYVLRKEQISSFGIALATGIAVSLFFHSNSFGAYYAIEDRAYSLWVSLSTIHYLFFLENIKRPLKRGAWIFYTIVSILMILTAYVSAAQICIAIGVSYLVWSPWSARAKSELPRNLLLLFVCGVLAAHYYFNVIQMTSYSPDWFTTKNYFDSLFDVTLKTIHIHHRLGFFILFPFIFLLIPYLCRKNNQYIAIWLSTIFLYLLTFFFYKGSQMKGGIWAPRYVIFLIPSLFAFYCANITAVFFYGEVFLKRFFRSRYIFVGLLALWSTAEIFSRIPSYWSSIKHDYVTFQQRNAISKSIHLECAESIVGPRFMFCEDSDPKKLEFLNEYCRGMSKELKP